MLMKNGPQSKYLRKFVFSNFSSFFCDSAVFQAAIAGTHTSPGEQAGGRSKGNGAAQDGVGVCLLSLALLFAEGRWCRVQRINQSSSSTNAVYWRPDVVHANLRSRSSSLSLTVLKDCDTAAAPRRCMVGLGLPSAARVGPASSLAALLPLLLPPACSPGVVCKGTSEAQDGLGVLCTAKCALSAVAAVSTAPSRL